MPSPQKTTIVLPAYNAAKTLKKTFDAIPKDCADEVILVDDASSDNTLEVAKGLGILCFHHNKNLGYGANQKTCYEEALRRGADIVVMVHPDYQYDPSFIPEMIKQIKSGEADAVFGSRMMSGGALPGGMPWWKYMGNIMLTIFENFMLSTKLSEYHTGFRAYSAALLRALPINLDSDDFVFDTEIIVQALIGKFRIAEIPISTRYFPEASTVKLKGSIVYGFKIIKTMIKYRLHAWKIKKFKQFEVRGRGYGIGFRV